MLRSKEYNEQVDQLTDQINGHIGKPPRHTYNAKCAMAITKAIRARKIPLELENTRLEDLTEWLFDNSQYFILGVSFSKLGHNALPELSTSKKPQDMQIVRAYDHFRCSVSDNHMTGLNKVMFIELPEGHYVVCDAVQNADFEEGTIIEIPYGPGLLVIKRAAFCKHLCSRISGDKDPRFYPVSYEQNNPDQAQLYYAAWNTAEGCMPVFPKNTSPSYENIETTLRNTLLAAGLPRETYCNTYLRILREFHSSPSSPINISRFTQVLSISRKTLQRHLQELEGYGVIRTHRKFSNSPVDIRGMAWVSLRKLCIGDLHRIKNGTYQPRKRIDG